MILQYLPLKALLRVSTLSICVGVHVCGCVADLLQTLSTMGNLCPALCEPLSHNDNAMQHHALGAEF